MSKKKSLPLLGLEGDREAVELPEPGAGVPAGITPGVERETYCIF